MCSKLALRTEHIKWNRVINITFLWQLSEGVKFYERDEDDDNGAKKQTTLIPQEVGILCNKTPVPSILTDLGPVLEKDKTSGEFLQWQKKPTSVSKTKILPRLFSSWKYYVLTPKNILHILNEKDVKTSQWINKRWKKMKTAVWTALRRHQKPQIVNVKTTENVTFFK